MGCDIHLVVEKKVNGKWITIKMPTYPKECVQRNYMRFGLLANVREEGNPPRGIPNDISESAQWLINEWDGDGHSHSYMTMKEALLIFLESQYFEPGILGPDTFCAKYPQSFYFDLDESQHKTDDLRIVFFFDN